ncbi:AAA family ATPase [Wohlfahrtiimonas chitiniclastica]|uniref:AAA family ATPase n=1 Tax=Wohlfahrtiimonas chitiniclastica TaxID=400946 RepID=UPI0007B414BE|nr:AAA family ATPase [Wohlfahrtiimonas chitiniclastica]KZS22770.1 hypothetical protein BMY_0597 [Wohlfahrtiimonas chitiniclastica]MDC7252997.1 hypothetical protein [Wohlfahrtiimonas chitiniclastica]WHR55219.1 AAA family ATPase [Wohlfahrtiimonas chitiniclastica]
MISDSNFTVVFTNEEKAIKAIYTDKICNKIYLFSRKTTWNDFAYKPYGKFLLRLNEVVVDGLVYVATFTEKYIESGKYMGIGNLDLPDSEMSNFFTLLEDMAAYRRLVNMVGPSVAKRILNVLNDLVEIKSRPDKKLLYNQAIASEIFRLAFMRNSEAFFAYHNAHDILRGIEFESFDYISKNLKLTFQLEGFSNPHEIFFSFGSSQIIPKRINVLIGENGLGKSQSLNQFIRAALQQNKCKHNLVALGAESQRPMISRLLAIGTPGETKNTYPNDSIKKPKIYYKRLVLTRNARSKNNKTICSSLIQLIRNKDFIGDETRYQIFKYVIANFFPLDSLVIPLKNYHTNYISLKDLDKLPGEQTRLELWSNIDDAGELKIQYKANGQLYPMSSGQLSFFKFALLACLHIENGSFVLLDEPETHLHPNFISGYIALLDNILEKTGSYGIIATHSPYFVREVAREQVHVFKKTNDGAIYISHPKLKTFGANIGDISYFVFDEEITNSLSQKILDKAKRESLSFEDIVSLSNSELPAEMLQEIKRKLS